MRNLVIGGGNLGFPSAYPNLHSLKLELARQWTIVGLQMGIFFQCIWLIVSQSSNKLIGFGDQVDVFHIFVTNLLKTPANRLHGLDQIAATQQFKNIGPKFGT
jgi:hypothetical protein